MNALNVVANLNQDLNRFYYLEAEVPAAERLAQIEREINRVWAQIEREVNRVDSECRPIPRASGLFNLMIETQGVASRILNNSYSHLLPAEVLARVQNLSNRADAHCADNY